MKKFVSICAIAVLAACSGEAGEDAAGEEAAAEEFVSPLVGTYEVTNSEGAVLHTIVNADGTYTDTTDGEQIGSGTWTESEDGICFYAAPEDPALPIEDDCYTMGEIAEDGTFTATATDGQEATVTKIN